MTGGAVPASPVSATAVGEYLKRLAAAGAVPGGGSAAAVAGAMGAALGAMVSRLSAKKASGEIQAELNGLVLEFERLCQALEDLSQADIDAYALVVRTRREAKARGQEPDPQAMAAAYEGATRVPLSTASLALHGLEFLGQLRLHAWVPTASDLNVARHLLSAAFEGGMANVAVNMQDLSEPAREQVGKEYQVLRSNSAGR